MSVSIADKRRRFRDLHQSGCFVIPNPWDIGSARYLASLGFKAIASTSAGFAFSRGVPDNAVGRDAVLEHLGELVNATDLPVNADYENGFAHDPDELAENVRLGVETGIAGISIEDSTGAADRPLYEFDQAVARIKAARGAIDKSGSDVMLVGRAECFLVGEPDIGETTRRLKAYADAGADCLYAPGIETIEAVAAVVKAVAPKPVNVLIGGPGSLTIKEVADLGVRRVSVGGSLARAAWGGLIRAATELAEKSSFDGFSGAAPHGELNKFFRNWKQ
ncbi:MAG TPA: isocitrate lyase/phosphoenolpyruvate mutase family protein [Pyrinomonadaceae bacterium]|nr:isocitrate lyase/phosphoenolpyruvate mutase family protein [Pyrinomonadaceae bacterium]